MEGRISRIILALFFVALFGAPLLYKRIAARNTFQGNAAESRRYRSAFQESSKSSGITFRHTELTLDRS